MKHKKWILTCCILILATSGFIINFLLEKKLDSLGVLDQHNILFDSDPSFRIKNFQQGMGSGGHEWVHLNLSNFVHPPVRALALLIYKTGLSKQQPFQIRRTIIMYLTPVAGAMKTVVLFIFFYLWGFDILSCVILSLLEMASFSRIIFNSIPEHFAFTSLLFALVFLLALLCLKRKKIYTFWWFLLAILITGITLSNIVVVMMIWGFLIYLQKNSLRAAIKKTGLYLIIILAINIGFALIMNSFILPKEKSINDGIKHEQFIAHSLSDVTQKFQNFTNTLTYVFISPEPEMYYNTGALAYDPDSKYDISFSFQNSRNNMIIIHVVILLIMFTGMLILFRDPKSQYILLFSLFLLLFNWIFHSIYGTELFLYSQHWVIAQIILIAGIFRLEHKLKFTAILVSIVLLIIIAVQNIMVMKLIIEILEKY